MQISGYLLILARATSAVIFSLLGILMLGLTGCAFRQPDFHLRFNSDEEGRLWAIADPNDTEVREPVEGSAFPTPYLHVSAHDHQGGSPVSRGATLKPNDERFIESIVKPARKGGRYHGLEGAIVFLARADLRRPDEAHAFWPFDWKFYVSDSDARDGKDWLLRLTLQVVEDETLWMKVWTGEHLAIEVRGDGADSFEETGKLTNVALGVSEKGIGFDKILNTVAITFRKSCSGWTTMKVYVVPEGGDITPRTEPVITKKFRVWASRVGWEKVPLRGYRTGFGIRLPDELRTNHVDLDELRFFSHCPQMIRGIPKP